MSPLATWLPAELSKAGLPVLLVDGWATRETRPGFEPQGLVVHDTVTPVTLSRAQEQAILRDGRPDLKGPLAQLGLHRDGYVSVIAAGRCSHNGYGEWGNDAFGLETFCYGGQAGHEEPYNPIQVATAEQIGAVICRHYGWDSSHVKGHKETDPHRKIDPFGVDMVKLRAGVAALLKPPIPVPTTRRPRVAVYFAPSGLCYLHDSPNWTQITKPTADALVAAGAVAVRPTAAEWNLIANKSDPKALGAAAALP